MERSAAALARYRACLRWSDYCAESSRSCSGSDIPLEQNHTTRRIARARLRVPTASSAVARSASPARSDVPGDHARSPRFLQATCAQVPELRDSSALPPGSVNSPPLVVGPGGSAYRTLVGSWL